MYSGCAYHCAAGTGFSHSITRDERLLERRASEQANGCTGQYHGMEWNGTEWQECYKISAFTVSARHSFTQLESSTTRVLGRARVRSRCKYFSVSFVLGVRCHRRRHRRLWRYSGSFLCVQSTYRCDASLSVVIGDRDRLPWYCPRPSFLSCEIDDNRSRDHCYLISTFYGHSWCCIVMRAHVHT